MDIESVENLQEILSTNGINTSLYGQGTAKSIQQLFNEIELGETILNIHNDKLTRKLYVMNICLIDGDKVLIEWQQKFHSTPDREEFIRSRYLSVAEKFYPNEKIEEVIIRSLKEELNINFDGLGILNINSSTEVMNSNSYPELESHYHYTSVIIDTQQTSSINIPHEKYYIFTEYFDNGNERLTTTWKWTTKEELLLFNTGLHDKVEKYLK